MKRPLLALFLSISMVAPTHSVRATSFVEPMVMAWQMMDAMRQMMEWFGGGNNRNDNRNQGGNNGWMPFGSLYSTPYGSNLNTLNLLGINRQPLQQKPDGEWLRDPEPYDESFWGDEIYSVNRSGYEGIDGMWLANSGERWMIRGQQFILRQANGAITKGEFKIKRDWIIVRYYATNMTISLQFRQMGDLLVIRDRSGMVVLLHRMPVPKLRNPNSYGGYFQ